MIDDRNFAEQTEQPNGNKKKKIWKDIGLGALSAFLAIFTILIINMAI